MVTLGLNGACDNVICDSGWLSCTGLTTDAANDDAAGCETSTSTSTDNLTGAGQNVHTNRGTSCTFWIVIRDGISQMEKPKKLQGVE